jgi:hypothetical protein
MMRRGVVAMVLAIVLAGVPGAAGAATCQAGLLDQSDLAGVYESVEVGMRATVYPCGALVVLWSNPYGTHEALYLGSERMPDGGIVSVVGRADPYVGTLDGRRAIGFMPAEPGYAKLLTLGPFADNVHVYRLAKV